MRAWRTHEYGLPRDALRVDDVPIPEPAEGEVRVRVDAIPLNLNDLERVTGGNMMVRPELPYSPGMEVMGVVDACGAGCEAFAGRRVAAITKQAFGGFAEYAICPGASTFDVPDSIGVPDAAAILFPFHLAYLGLVDRAAIRPGETVLVHAAAGGSGSAAVQLAVANGASVVATVGSDDKKRLCEELGAGVVVNYSRDDFVPAVMEATGGRGADVVFDNVGEAVMERSFACTAYNGRYLMMGFASDKVVADEKLLVPRRIALGNLKLCGVLLAYADDSTRDLVKQAMGWNFASAALGRRVHAAVLDLLEQGRVRTVVGQVVGFDALPAALDDLASRRTVGRTIVMVR